jgi:phospholipid/cholesterol/gamma-HCH transport system substrate-binding protein
MKIKNLSANATRAVIGVLVIALVATGVFFEFFSGSTKKVTADFPEAIGVYAGSDVRVDGIKIGTITSVKAEGSHVRVAMEYDSKIKLGSDAIATVISSSLVADRYVQLAPLVTSGKVLADHANITRTYQPVELDDIYSALNTLSAALGPNGANKNGALSDLVNVAAADLKGNGTQLGQSITNVSKAAQTLANGRDDLFGTVKNLQSFVQTLSESDASVKKFNTELATVAGELADERGALADTLKNLSSALDSLAGFIKYNQAAIHTDVTGLESITGILAKDKAALNETLAVAPVALANLVHTYNASSGTLDQRSNLSSLTDAGSLCSILNLILKGNLSVLDAPSQAACAAVAKTLPGGSLPTTLPGVQQVVGDVTGLLGGSIAIPGTTP